METIPAEEFNQAKADVDELIAELSLKCRELEVKHNLMLYQYGRSTIDLAKRFDSLRKEQLTNLLDFLNNNVINLPVPALKKDIINDIICRIQNLLPDICGMCNQRFKLRFNEAPILQCARCFQSSHRECVQKIIENSQVNIQIEELNTSNEILLYNPNNIPGVHYFCKACSEDLIPDATPHKTPSSSGRIIHTQISTPDAQASSTEDPDPHAPDPHAGPTEAVSEPPIIDATAQENVSDPTYVPTSADASNADALDPNPDPPGSAAQGSHGTQTDQSPTPPVSQATPVVQQTSVTTTSAMEVAALAIQTTNTSSAPASWATAPVSQVIPVTSTNTVTVSSLPTAVASNTDTSNTGPLVNTITKNRRICKFFDKGSCEHGTSGENCRYQHPELCRRFIQNGTRQPRGCNQGNRCKFFHPTMCMDSLRKSECLDQRCSFRHTLGTRRNPTNTTINQGNQQTQAVQPSTAPASQATPVTQPNSATTTPATQVAALAAQAPNASSTPETGDTSPAFQGTPTSPANTGNQPDLASFLEAVRLLKCEVLETMDTRLALLKSEICMRPGQQQPQQPQLLNHQLQQQQPVLVQPPVTQQPVIPYWIRQGSPFQVFQTPHHLQHPMQAWQYPQVMPNNPLQTQINNQQATWNHPQMQQQIIPQSSY